MKQSFVQLVGTTTTALVVAFLFFVGVVVVIAAWDEPLAGAPDQNAARPIGVSVAPQYKAGALGVGGLMSAYLDARIDGNVSAKSNGLVFEYTYLRQSSTATSQRCACDTTLAADCPRVAKPAQSSDPQQCYDRVFIPGNMSGCSGRGGLGPVDADGNPTCGDGGPPGPTYPPSTVYDIYEKTAYPTGGDVIAKTSLTMRGDRRTAWPLRDVKIIPMNYDQYYECPAGYAATTCGGSGEKSCYPELNQQSQVTGRFICRTENGARGSNCFLFCAFQK